MNAQKYTKNLLKAGLTSFGQLLLAVQLIMTATSAQALDSFQQKVLFHPTESILMAEANGRIMIFDGVKSESVDQAMDEQFDRIETMMFVNTLYQQDDGEYLVENDDCDSD